MSQHDLTIDNQGFPAFRADLNNALQALGSTQSGTTAPSPTFANQLWYDTTNNQLKIRNEDNDAWITLLTLDQVADAVSTITGSTINAGALTASGNVSFDGGTFVFNDSGADKDFRIEGDTDANLFFTDASTDRVGIGTNTPALKLSVVGSSLFTGTTNSVYSKYSNTGSDFWVGVDSSTGGDFGTSTAYARVIYSSGAYPLVFSTNDIERLRIPSDAAGIKFPATQAASSDANTLDDYEEGTWTPTFSSASGTITTYSASGTYTKIGRIVYLYASITVSNIGTASGIGNWGGAPFTPMAALQTNANRIAIFTVREDFNTGTMFQGYMNASNTNGNILTTGNNALTWTNGNIYEFSFTYQV